MQREFSAVADFALIYVEEAHPTDGWIHGAVRHHVKQPTTLAQRCEMAGKLGEELRRLGGETSLYVDLMANGMSHAFGALPERLAIVKSGTVRFIGGSGPERYSVPDAVTALRKLL